MDGPAPAPENNDKKARAVVTGHKQTSLILSGASPGRGLGWL